MLNRLTEAEVERLALLTEEMGESLQILGKILRHGFHSSNPNLAKSPANRHLLCKELGDVKYAIDLLVKAGDLSQIDLDNSRDLASIYKPKYLHHQDEKVLREL